MATRLKNDWKARGNNPHAKQLAQWMNTVADQFNHASVPSGGTAQPTSQGFQIEIDGESNLPFDCTLGAETATDSGEYEVTIREGCFIYPDANGEEQSVIANNAVPPETLANYDFATMIDLTSQIAASGVTSALPIVAAVMYETTAAPDVIKAALVPLGRDLDTTTDFPVSTHIVHAVVPISEVIFPGGEESPYLNQLHRGFIYVDPISSQIDLPFDIRANQTTGNIEFYATSNGAITTDMVYLNGEELSWQSEPTPTGIEETGWVELATAPTTGNTTTIYFYLVVDTAASPAADLTSNSVMKWEISTTANATGDTGIVKQRVIATVENSSGVYTVTQFLRGSQSINARYTDNESATELDANDEHKTQSIDTQTSGGKDSLTLFGFKAGTTITAPSNLTGIVFLIRKVVAGFTKLQYLDGPDLETVIQTIIDSNISLPLDHENNGEITGKLILGGGTEHYHVGTPYIDATDPENPIITFDHGDLTGLSDDDHDDVTNGYIRLGGDETRNTMTATAYIGDSSSAKSIWPSGRQLMNGATVVVDWILRKLSGGAWTVTDTTEATGSAGSSAGALVVDGGVNIKDNLIVQDTTEATGTAGTTAGALVVDGGVNIKDNLIVQDATAASYTGSGSGAIKATGGIYVADGIAAKNATATWCAAFNDTVTGANALLAGTYGGQFYTTVDDGVVLSDGTYGVNAGLINAAVAYYHNDVQGVDVTNWTGGGIVTGTDIIEIDASDLRPTDKILVRR